MLGIIGMNSFGELLWMVYVRDENFVLLIYFLLLVVDKSIYLFIFIVSVEFDVLWVFVDIFVKELWVSGV